MSVRPLVDPRWHVRELTADARRNQLARFHSVRRTGAELSDRRLPDDVFDVVLQGASLIFTRRRAASASFGNFLVFGAIFTIDRLVLRFATESDPDFKQQMVLAEVFSGQTQGPELSYSNNTLTVRDMSGILYTDAFARARAAGEPINVSGVVAVRSAVS